MNCQMITRPFYAVNIHKACSENRQELDAPMNAGVEAPHQGERENPQQ